MPGIHAVPRLNIIRSAPLMESNNRIRMVLVYGFTFCQYFDGKHLPSESIKFIIPPDDHTLSSRQSALFFLFFHIFVLNERHFSYFVRLACTFRAVQTVYTVKAIVSSDGSGIEPRLRVLLNTIKMYERKILDCVATRVALM